MPQTSGIDVSHPVGSLAEGGRIGHGADVVVQLGCIGIVLAIVQICECPIVGAVEAGAAAFGLQSCGVNNILTGSFDSSLDVFCEVHNIVAAVLSDSDSSGIACTQSLECILGVNSFAFGQSVL